MFEDNGRHEAVPPGERWQPSTWLADVVTAASFLTRLPLSGFLPEQRPVGQAMAAFPVVGAFAGLACGAALFVSNRIGLSPLAAAAIAVGCHVLLTGGLHEDGLADSADGFWGGDNPQRRLAIMRDSHIGTFGALALLLAFLLKCALIAEIATSSLASAVASLVAAGAVSRHAIVALMASAEPARSDGLAWSAGKPTAETWRASLLIALAVAAVTLWWAQGLLGAMLSLLLAQGAVSGTTALARRKVGGYTGDVCGAVQQVSEIAVLAGMAMTTG